MTLHTDRLTLRRPAARDADAVTEFFMSERSAVIGGHLPRPDAWRKTALNFGHWDIRGYGLWAVTTRDDDTILGLVGPNFPEGWPETEIGWMMLDGSEGKGYALEAAQAAIADARTRLGWTTVVHYIGTENARSIALAQRLGARVDPDATLPRPDMPAVVYRQPQVRP